MIIVQWEPKSQYCHKYILPRNKNIKQIKISTILGRDYKTDPSEIRISLRDEEIGIATIIETAGGGVEILGKIGVVDDYYNLIHRHNINNNYLSKAVDFRDKKLTQEEIDKVHLSTLKLSYEEAIHEYERCSVTRLGRLEANREMPILRQAKILLDRKHIRDVLFC